ncbi:MAG: hypothetical protein AB7K24_15520 [Gemmataceae bacterium]
MSQTEVFRSRWGYHPCSYETFLLLKELNREYERAVRQVAAWRRWHRKAPRNRVSQPRLRNEKGQRIGYGPPAPIPEPPVCSIFAQIVQVRRFVDREGNACSCGYFEPEATLESPTVALAYRQARFPVATAADVKSLEQSTADIRRLHEALQASRG